MDATSPLGPYFGCNALVLLLISPPLAKEAKSLLISIHGTSAQTQPYTHEELEGLRIELSWPHVKLLTTTTTTNHPPSLLYSSPSLRTHGELRICLAERRKN